MKCQDPGSARVCTLTTEVKGINRVLYDFTPKGPATIEYE